MVLNNLIMAFDPYTFYFAMSITFMIIMVILSIAMIIIVMLQKGTDNNLGAITGSSDSFFGKNKSRSVDAKLKRATVGIAAGILISSVLFFVIQILKNAIG